MPNPTKITDLSAGDVVQWGRFTIRLVEPCIDDGVPDMCRSEEHDGEPMQVWRIFNITNGRESFACSHGMVRVP